jgi:hypothetical protein
VNLDRRPWPRRRLEVEGAEVDADQLAGMPPAELDRHARADIAAVGAEPFVAEPVAQQPAPAVGGRRLEHGPGRRVGEAVPGQRGDHHVEGVPGLPAVGGRVGEQRQQLQVLDERAREAMGSPGGQQRPQVPGVGPVPPAGPGGMVRPGGPAGARGVGRLWQTSGR